MTTIVYCHKTKQIACDSRVTAGCTIADDSAEKFKFHNDEMWFFAGAVPDVSLLMDVHEKKTKASNVDCWAIVASAGGVFSRGFDRERGRYMPYELLYSWAIGSGTDHALTAIDMGATAKEAVEIAMKRDCNSGGKIWVFDCVTIEFIE